MAIGDNIRRAREAAGLSQEKLGEAFGVRRQAVQQWETGGGIELDKIPKLAKTLAMSVSELFEEQPRFIRELAHASDRVLSYNHGHVADHVAPIPVLSWDQVKQLGAVGGSTVCIPEGSERAESSLTLGSHAFLVRITGDAMDDGSRDSIPDSTDAVFNTSLVPRHGDFVLAVLQDQRVLFRRYDITSEGTYLVALNPAHPDRILGLPSDGRIVAVLERTIRTFR